MTETSAVLELDLEPGTNADAAVAAQALIDWVKAIQAAAAVIDPIGETKVSLISAEPACIRFKTVLQFIENKVMAPTAEALDPYPRLKTFLALNILALPGTLGIGLAIEALKPDEKTEAARNSPVVQQHVQNFYKTVQRDSAIKRVVVRERADGPAVISVDKAEFAERSGLWEPQPADDGDRQGGGIWTVVVTHPVAIAKPLTWGFMRDGLPFRAKMVDQKFLAAVKDGSLPITLQEGVTMRIRLSYREKLEGQLWVPVQGTYRVEEVISPEI